MMPSAPLIAIDIGSSAIKLAEISGDSKKSLKALGLELLPDNVISGGMVREPQILQEALQRLVDKLKIVTIGRRAVVALGGSALLVKRLTIALPPGSTLDEEISANPEKYLEGNLEQVSFDAVPLFPPRENGEQTFLMVHARSDIISQYIEVLANIGLKTSTVDVDTFALANMFEHNYGITDSLIALVNIGAHITQVSLIAAGKFLYTRDVAFGGSDFTLRLAEALNIPPMEAEDLKISISQGSTTPNPEAMKVLGNTSIELAEEVKRAIMFYFQEAEAGQFGPIRLVYMSGGGAKTMGLDANFASAMNVPIQILNPFQKIHVNPKIYPMDFVYTQGHMFGVVMGLALRKFRDRNTP